jgi:alkyl sulfatase BDS1-like metallo-beta-lactamase superfamily hydrolase
MANPVIKGKNGTTVWSLKPYEAFITNTTIDDAPDTINPSLYRMCKLNMYHGLFEVVPGIYQLRGYDLAIMTLVKGNSGWIVIDPMTTIETVNATWKELVEPNLGVFPVKAVIYTHSHSDHIGGTRALLTDAQVANGEAKIIAPDNFIEAAVGENIIAGNAMVRVPHQKRV